MTDRPTAIRVETPYEGATVVVCYQDTMTRKIIPAKRVDGDPIPIISRTLRDPAAVCTGTSNPGYIAYVNTSEVTPGSQTPFVVFVDPKGSPLPAVASVGFRRDYADLSGHTVLWRRNET